jgi:hypothetical protein
VTNDYYDTTNPPMARLGRRTLTRLTNEAAQPAP